MNEKTNISNLTLTSDKSLSSYTVIEPNKDCIQLNCGGVYHQKLNGLVCGKCGHYIPLQYMKKVNLNTE